MTESFLLGKMEDIEKLLKDSLKEGKGPEDYE